MVKTKLKPILPSLREKKRYLVFEVISKEKINDINSVSNTIWNYSLQFLGQLGTAKAGLMVLDNKWNSELQRGIIKVSHKHVDALKSALMFADKIDGKNVIFRSLGVSGILNKAERKFEAYPARDPRYARELQPSKTQRQNTFGTCHWGWTGCDGAGQ